MDFTDGTNDKELPGNAGDIRGADLVPGLGRCLENEMATHSSILAWKTPWTEELVGCSSQGRKGSDTTEMTYHAHMRSFLQFCHTSPPAPQIPAVPRWPRDGKLNFIPVRKR